MIQQLAYAPDLVTETLPCDLMFRPQSLAGPGIAPQKLGLFRRSRTGPRKLAVSNFLA